MRASFKWIAAGGLLLGAAAAILFVVALRDTTARPALGEARYASSGEAIIEYHAMGPADGVVVVLFPSFARSAADFNELVRDLSSADFRTLAVQPRGVEGSTLPAEVSTYHTYAADLLAVLDAEDVREPVHVLGHAYGNRIARTFASDYPSRTRSVVLLAAGGATPTPPDVSEAIGKAMLSLLSDSVRREAIAFAFFARGNEVAPDWMLGWYPDAALAEMKAIQATPYVEWGHAGAAPILVLQPAEDAAAESGGRLLAEAFSDRVELVEIAGAGHALLPERPAVVSETVLRFLLAR
jgi:pimeloyl-ACP methyl ester carboxylesterase